MSGRRSPLVRTIAALGSMMLGTAVLMGALPGSAGAEEAEESVTSISVVEGENLTCATLDEFKIDDIDEMPDELPEQRLYEDEDDDSEFEVEIFDVDDDPVTFSFESNIPVSAVFVKAGNGGILYTYEPPTKSGTGLESPMPSISHISFCWNEEDDEESTASSMEKDKESATSSTEKDEESATSSTEKDRESTTTTVADEETTTTVAGEEATTTTVSPTGALPRTGSTTFPLVVVGALLLAGGFGLLLTTRLRRS